MLPVVYDYTNYRAFLKDFYAAKKSEKKSYSFQYMAQKAGFKSKASFANIISGVQALSNRTVFDVAHALGLGKRETEYFEALVHFNNAVTGKEKEVCFERMRSLAPKSDVTLLVESQYDYYSQWYHCAVRELATQIDFKGDFAALAQKVDPSITPAQARKSVELLLRLGMLEKLPEGGYRQSDRILMTGDEVASLALQNYHRSHLALAAESISRHDRAIRETSSVTLGLSKQGFHKLKTEIQQFRKRLLAIASEESTSEAVYQVAFQAYPISKTPKDWRG